MSHPTLEPVEGITVEQWASGQAKIASGGTLDEVTAMLGMDAAKWDRVNNEWMTRMSNDTEFVIIPVYSAAFNQKASGNLGAGNETSQTSLSFEKWVECMAAQSVLGAMGRDAQDVLKDFGLTVADYSNVSSYWNGELMKDFSLATKMSTLMDEYTKKYESMGGGSMHDDLNF